MSMCKMHMISTNELKAWVGKGLVVTDVLAHKN